jgi:hypothetical protein
MHLPRFALTRRHAALAVLGALAFGVMAAAWQRLDSKWEAYKFARWQERQIAWFQGDGFDTLTPAAHYYWAMRLVHPRTNKVFQIGKNTSVVGGWIAEPSTDALKTAIRHLEAISPGSDGYLKAAEVLPFLRLKRDRPQDFPAVEQARFLSCIASFKAERTKIQEQVARERPCRHLLTRDGKCIPFDFSHDTPDTAIEVVCAPVAGSERLAQLKALVQDAP